MADTSSNPRARTPGHDKLAHVRPILEKVRLGCKAQYHPHREVSVDEAMVGFSGRLGFKQYVPLKPTKREIKVWVRADPSNGYTNDFQVYTGRTQEGTEKNLGARVVRDLMSPIYNLGHVVFCDSFFTSPTLYTDLLEHETYGCGTVKSNRKGLPQNLQTLKLKNQGESKVQQKGDLQVISWRDKKVINILSTVSGENTSVNRKKKDGIVAIVQCPYAVSEYNKYMNGVDRADQLGSTYTVARKALKWWKYLFFYLFDVCIVNAFILMKESPAHQLKTKTNRPRDRTQLEFRMKLARQMLAAYTSKRKRPATLVESVNTSQHWPAVMPKKGYCKMCSMKHIRREPVTGCEQCQVNLCTKCFKPYHLLK